MAPECYSFGPFRLFPAEHLLKREEQTIPLAPKAFELLVLLVRSQGHLMLREALMEAVWADSFVEEINLTVNISLLRKVLGSLPDGTPYIATVPKRGYRFQAPVTLLTLDAPALPNGLASRNSTALNHTERVIQLAEPEPPSATEIINKTTVPASNPVLPDRVEQKRSFNSLKAFVALLIIVGAGLLLWAWRRTHQPSSQVLLPSSVHSLAVLPFTFIGEDPSLSYLGLGMTDALVTRLSGQGRIVVRPIGAVRQYAGAADPLNAGRSLHVDAVLDGTIQRAAGETRVTVRLLQVKTGATLWTGSFDEAAETAFALEDRISQRLTQALMLSLSDEEQKRLSARHTQNSVAYDLYTRGRFLLNQRTIESVRQSINLFQQAIQIDPGYAAAHAGLADAYILAGSYGNSFLAPTISAPKAEEAESKALALDINSPEAHTSLAYLRLTYDWDWPGAEREFQRAIQLDPSYVNAHHWYSHELLALGRVDESHKQSEIALSLDPTDVVVNEHMAWHHLFARQYDEAIAQGEKAVEIDPNFVQAHRVLGLAYLYKGESSKGCAEFEIGARLSHQDPVAEAYLARCYALTHKEAAARGILDTLVKSAHERYISAAEIGAVYASLGEGKQAEDWLNKAVGERASALIYLNIDPVFDRLRHDPDFRQIVSKIGLPTSDEGSRR